MSVTTEIPSYIYVYMPFQKYFYAEAVPKDIVQVMNVFSRFTIRITHATKYYINISCVLLLIYEFDNVKRRNIEDLLNAFWMVLRLKLTYHIGFI